MHLGRSHISPSGLHWGPDLDWSFAWTQTEIKKTPFNVNAQYQQQLKGSPAIPISLGDIEIVGIHMIYSFTPVNPSCQPAPSPSPTIESMWLSRWSTGHSWWAVCWAWIPLAQQVGGLSPTAGVRMEILHDEIPQALLHLTQQHRDGEISGCSVSYTASLLLLTTTTRWRELYTGLTVCLWN